MTAAIQALSTLLPVLYLITTGLYGMGYGGPRAPRTRRLRLAAIAALLVAHVAYWAVLWRMVGHFPVFHAWTAISMLAFGLVVFYLPVEWRTRNGSVGLFVFGLAFLLQLMASAFGPLHPGSSHFKESRFFLIHVTTIVFSLAALVLSGFCGGLYLVLLRKLKSRDFGLLYGNLPDLQTLTRMTRSVAVLGFVLMTVGLNIGIWWAHDGKIEGFSYRDPKILAAITCWITFGVIGTSRWIGFLSARRAAQVAVGGLCLVFLIYMIQALPGFTFHNKLP